MLVCYTHIFHVISYILYMCMCMSHTLICALVKSAPYLNEGRTILLFQVSVERTVLSEGHERSLSGRLSTLTLLCPL